MLYGNFVYACNKHYGRSKHTIQRGIIKKEHTFTIRMMKIPLMFDFFSSFFYCCTAFIPQNVHPKLTNTHTHACMHYNHTLSAAFHLLVPVSLDAFVFIHLQLSIEKSLFNRILLGMQGQLQASMPCPDEHQKKSFCWSIFGSMLGTDPAQNAVHRNYIVQTNTNALMCMMKE